MFWNLKVPSRLRMGSSDILDPSSNTKTEVSRSTWCTLLQIMIEGSRFESHDRN